MSLAGEDRGGADESRRRLLLGLLDAGGEPAGRVGRSVAVPAARLLRLCTVATSRARVDAAGVTVMGDADAGRTGHRDQLAAVGTLAGRLEQLQLTAGEGPCLDAYGSGLPVLVGDLAAESTRWLAFAPGAIASGAAAVFSFPLQVGAVRLGTLDLSRAAAGRLSREELGDALALADLATEVLLEPVGEVRADVDGAVTGGAEYPPPEGWLADVHADVHVASGMVSARAGIDVRAALLRIRAHAFASGVPIHDVARRIIEHDLVLDHPSLDETARPPEQESDGP